MPYKGGSESVPRSSIAVGTRARRTNQTSRSCKLISEMFSCRPSAQAMLDVFARARANRFGGCRGTGRPPADQDLRGQLVKTHLSLSTCLAPPPVLAPPRSRKLAPPLSGPAVWRCKATKPAGSARDAGGRAGVLPRSRSHLCFDRLRALVVSSR